MKLSNAWLRSGALARLPPEALRLLWWIAAQRRRELFLVDAATALTLTYKQVVYSSRALQRAKLLRRTRTGYTVHLPQDFSQGFTRWMMNPKVTVYPYRLRGAEFKLFTLLQSLLQGRDGWVPIRTRWLMRVLGMQDGAFRTARARLVELGVIQFRAQPRRATRYVMAQWPNMPVLPQVYTVPALPEPPLPNTHTEPVTQPITFAVTPLAKARGVTDNFGGESLTKERRVADKKAVLTRKRARRRSLSASPDNTVHPSGGGGAARPSPPSLPTMRVQHETLHIAFRALHLKPLSPGSAYGTKALAAMRARLREGFTIAELLSIARFAGRERAEAEAKGRGHFVRKLRNLCYCWGTEASVLLADATAPPVTPSSTGPYRMEPAAREALFARLKAESDAATREHLARVDRMLGET